MMCCEESWEHSWILDEFSTCSLRLRIRFPQTRQEKDMPGAACRVRTRVAIALAGGGTIPQQKSCIAIISVDLVTMRAGERFRSWRVSLGDLRKGRA